MDWNETNKTLVATILVWKMLFVLTHGQSTAEFLHLNFLNEYFRDTMAASIVTRDFNTISRFADGLRAVSGLKRSDTMPAY